MFVSFSLIFLSSHCLFINCALVPLLLFYIFISYFTGFFFSSLFLLCLYSQSPAPGAGRELSSSEPALAKRNTGTALTVPGQRAASPAVATPASSQLASSEPTPAAAPVPGAPNPNVDARKGLTPSQILAEERKRVCNCQTHVFWSLSSRSNCYLACVSAARGRASATCGIACWCQARR